VIALIDITDLKRSAAALRMAHDDAKTIIDTMPVPSLMIGFDRRVQMANQAFSDTFKCERSETEGKTVFQLGGGQWNIPSLIAALDELFNRSMPFHGLAISQDFPEVGHKDLLLQATATRLSDTPETNTALLAIDDLTARKQADDQLRHVEARYQHLLETANDGILILTDKGGIEFANRRVEAMFGYAPGALNGQRYEQLIPVDLREIEAMRAPEPRDIGRGMDLYGCRKDGSVFPVEISLSPATVNATTVVTAIVRDISERTKMESERQQLLTRETDARHEAERASLMKDEFLATLSHELRTPLTTILTWAQILRLGQVDPEKTKRAIAVIEKSAKDQGQLIDDLLDVSRIQAGKLTLDLRDIDLHDCINAALDSVRGQADAKSQSIRTDFDRSICAISADPGRLEQVFRNLLTNAVKFTPPRGTITVRSKLKSDDGVPSHCQAVEKQDEEAALTRQESSTPANSSYRIIVTSTAESPCRFGASAVVTRCSCGEFSMHRIQRLFRHQPPNPLAYAVCNLPRLQLCHQHSRRPGPGRSIPGTALLGGDAKSEPLESDVPRRSQ